MKINVDSAWNIHIGRNVFNAFLQILFISVCPNQLSSIYAPKHVGEDGREANEVVSVTSFDLRDLTHATIYNVTVTAIAGVVLFEYRYKYM